MFFSGSRGSIDGDRLIVALYNMGRDRIAGFDLSTYEDLVSTGRLGLITDVNRRQTIQRAYIFLQRLQEALEPYRDEYLIGVGRWIPQSMIDQIQSICPRLDLPEWTCPEIDFDEEAVQLILDRISGDEALIVIGPP